MHALVVHLPSGRWLVSVLVSFTPVRHCPPQSTGWLDEHVAEGVKPWRTVLRTPRKRVMGQLIRGFKSHLHRSDLRRYSLLVEAALPRSTFSLSFRPRPDAG